jgi:hypothetical protein
MNEGFGTKPKNILRLLGAFIRILACEIDSVARSL